MTDPTPPPLERFKAIVRQHPAAAIVLAALLIYWLLLASAPVTERKPRPERALLVETQVLEAQTYTPVFEAFGEVEPVTRVEIRAQVAGVVTERSPGFAPGGHVGAGQPLLTIDDRDYRQRLAQAQADLAVASENLTLEQGRKRSAELEWQRANPAGESGSPSDLATRGPQLRAQQAAVQRARAAVNLAQLNLQRTRVSLPFTARIESVEVGTGTLAQVGTLLGRAFSAEQFWVVAKLPARSLDWLAGEPVQPIENAIVRLPDGGRIPAQIRSRFGNVDPEGLLGQVLVEIRSDAETTPLLAGQYVDLMLFGPEVRDVLVVPRSAVYNSDTIYLVDGAQRLEEVTITPLLRDERAVVIEAAAFAGRHLVTSTLAGPIPGTPVEIAGSSAPTPATTP